MTKRKSEGNLHNLMNDLPGNPDAHIYITNNNNNKKNNHGLTGKT
jgi:hypothetical protein